MELVDQFNRISQAINRDEEQRQGELLSRPKDDLQHWLARIRAARTKGEVLATVEEFRLGDWPDTERSKMSHCYVNRLSVIDCKQDF